MEAINIQRRDTGPDHADRAGPEFIPTDLEITHRLADQRDSFDACDLSEEVDEQALALAKAGDALALGQLLISRMNATVQRRAFWWVSL